MTEPLRVEPVTDARSQRAFLAFPYRLHHGRPGWVPPLRMAERKTMDPRRNPFFAHGSAQHFLALRGKRVVGRVAAIENRLHNEIHGDRVGFFGFFDVEPDAEATAGLIDAARTWTRARGLGPLRGPVCYSTNEVCGVLVDGFDDPPMLMMPWNRPDYDALLMGAGLHKAKDLLAYWIPTADPVPERMRRVVERRMARGGVTLRPLDLKHLDRELPILRDIYNRSWELNWGFVPATDAEFDAMAEDLKAVVDPDLSAVAEMQGRPVGMSLILLDLNELLQGTSGRLTPRFLFRVLFRLKRVRRVRIVALGVVPEARGRAVNEAFFVRAKDGAAAKGIRGGEAGWVLEDNERMAAPILAVGGRVSKRYRLYEDV